MISRRASSGNMLILTVAITAFIAVVIVIFLLNLVRFCGSYQEQRTAIEAASIAAAKSISRIVIEDPNFGFISLSDRAPTGRATMAGDNYFLPVTGINTLLATVRLDMIVADVLDDLTLKRCASADYDNAMLARQALSDKLSAAIQPGGSGLDADGNKVEPVLEATAAYNANQIRLTGKPTRLLPGSLKLTLGSVPGLTTNTRIPYPTSYAQMSQDQQDSLFYKADMNIPYKPKDFGGQKDFVFAATANNVNLVDYVKFQPQIQAAPYTIPAVVKCEADEEYTGNQTGSTAKRIIHAVACAQAASLVDNRPAPGDFVLSFPDGAITSVGSIHDLFMSSGIAKSPSDFVVSPLTGDNPSEPLAHVALPVLTKEHAPFGQLLRVGLYDWIRRGGSRVDIESLQSALQKSLSVSPGSHADVFSIKSDGSIVYKEVTPCIGDLPVSHKQYMGNTGLTFIANGEFYDIYLRDFVYQPGRIKGGVHGGEPFPWWGLTGKKPPYQGNTIVIEPGGSGAFPLGPSGGAVRETYQKNGIAVEFRMSYRFDK